MAKKEKKEQTKTRRHLDAGQIFVKIMAAILAIIMVVAMAGTLIYYISIM